MSVIFWGNPAPPTTYPSVDFPAPTHGNVGDVYIRSTTSEQFRWNGSTWDALAPTETRGDTARIAGQTNDRLSKVGSRPFELGWRNAADGVVREINYYPPEYQPAKVWTINHQLTSRWVDVTVLSPGNEAPTAPQALLVPEVEFVNPSQCRLHFAKEVAGTAIVRR